MAFLTKNEYSKSTKVNLNRQGGLSFAREMYQTNNRRMQQVHNSGMVSNVGIVINQGEACANLIALIQSTNAEISNNGSYIFKHYFKDVCKSNDITLRNSKGIKYNGLQPLTYNVDGCTTSTVLMSNAIQSNILLSAAQCDINNKQNQIKILEDINHVFRFYGEGTIDFFKTGVEVDGKFMSNTIKNISSLHMINDVEFLSFENLLNDKYEYKIDYNVKNATIPKNLKVGETIVQVLNKFTGESKLFYKDYIDAVRSTILTEEVEWYVNEVIRTEYKGIGCKTSCPYSLRTIMDMKTLFITPFGLNYVDKINEKKKLNEYIPDDDEYSDEMDKINNECNAEIESITRLFNYLVKTLGMDLAEAGRLLYAASTFEPSVDKKQLNLRTKQSSAFKEISPYCFLAHCQANSGEEYCYADVFGDKELIKTIEDGSIVEIKDDNIVGTNGMVYIDANGYTGKATFTNEVVNDNYKPVVKVNMKQMIIDKFNEDAEDCNEFIVKVFKDSFIDQDKLEEGVWELNDDRRGLDQALADPDAVFTLMPVCCFTCKGTPIVKRNILMAKSHEKESLVAQFYCNSNMLQNIYAGVQFTSEYVYVDDDELFINIHYEECSRIQINNLPDLESSAKNIKVDKNAFVDKEVSKNSEVNNPFIGNTDNTDNANVNTSENGTVVEEANEEFYNSDWFNGVDDNIDEQF